MELQSWVIIICGFITTSVPFHVTHSHLIHWKYKIGINAALTFFLSAGVISNWTNETRIPPCTIYQAFQYFLDITTPPSPVLLQQFAALATNDKQKKKLEILSKVKSLLALALLTLTFTIIELHWALSLVGDQRHTEDLRCMCVGYIQIYAL